MTRLLFGLVSAPAPRVHRWSHRAAFAAGVAAGVVIAWTRRR